MFLEPQAVTLTELPGGTVQTLPAGSTFEGTVTALNSHYPSLGMYMYSGVAKTKPAHYQAQLALGLTSTKKLSQVLVF